MTTIDRPVAELLSTAADPAEPVDTRVEALRQLPPQALRGPELLALRRTVDAEPARKTRGALAAALHSRTAPSVLDHAARIAADEQSPAALRTAARAVRTLRATAPTDLTKATRLAYACEAAGREQDAVLVARYALAVVFTGDYTIWSPVESALALLWWHTGPDERVPLRQVLDVGTAEPEIARGPLRGRLDGELLPLDRIRRALDEGDFAAAVTWSTRSVEELTLLLAYGGSAAWPPERLAARRTEDLDVIRSATAFPARPSPAAGRECQEDREDREDPKAGAEA